MNKPMSEKPEPKNQASCPCGPACGCAPCACARGASGASCACTQAQAERR
jgi:hypothetical protein